MRFLLILFFSILSLQISFSKSLTQKDELIPRKLLFGNLERSGISISPNGKYIAYLANKNGIRNIWITPLDNLKKAEVITNETKRDLSIYSWISDNYIVFHKDQDGDENYGLNIYNIKTKTTKVIYSKKGVKSRIAMHSPKYPDILILTNNERTKKYFDYYKYNIKTGETESFFKNTKKFLGIMIDHNLNIRVGFKLDSKAASNMYLYENGKWIFYTKTKYEDSVSTSIISLTKDGKQLYYFDGRFTDKNVLKVMDLKTKESKTLAKGEKSDLYTFAVDPITYKVQGIYEYYEKPKIKILDQSFKKDYDFLKKFKDKEFSADRTRDNKKWLVFYYSDNELSKCYLYDKDKKAIKFLFPIDKRFEKYKFSKKTPVIIKSRDGLDLVSYLTIPNKYLINDKNIKTKKPLPMVLLVHGGPQARDDKDFDFEHQWLANRGYAVLSVNFRGSTGLGKKFMNAGNREWGGKMHDDLIDAVDWAIKNKIADPKKIAIMGASYGGYATLVGLTFTPDKFACGIDMVGPSNLITMLKTIPAYWKPLIKIDNKTVGSTRTLKDRRFLRSRSPLTYANKIKKPLFIIQGANDPRVKQSESDQIVNAMKKNNIKYMYALYHDEGHGLGRSQNEISYIALAEHFLAKVLGGRAEPMTEKDFEGANFSLNEQKPNLEFINGLIENTTK